MRWKLQYRRHFLLTWWWISRRCRPAVNFTNIFEKFLSYVSFARCFFVLTINICAFWCKNCSCWWNFLGQKYFNAKLQVQKKLHIYFCCMRKLLISCWRNWHLQKSNIRDDFVERTLSCLKNDDQVREDRIREGQVRKSWVSKDKGFVNKPTYRF